MTVYALIRNAKLMTMLHPYREQHPLHSLGYWIPPQTVHLLPGSRPPHDLGTEGVPRDWPNYPLRWGICCLLYMCYLVLAILSHQLVFIYLYSDCFENVLFMLRFLNSLIYLNLWIYQFCSFFLWLHWQIKLIL